MSETNTGALSVIDLGGVSIDAPSDGNRIGIDFPLDQPAVDFFAGVLDRLEKLGGLPRLLFIASASKNIEAGITAVGLARAAAGRNVRTLLVDALLDQPTLAKPFPYQPEEGLVDMVLWGASVQATLRKTRDEHIQLISAGSPPPDPELIFHSDDIESVLHTFREQADFAVITGPLFDQDGIPSPLIQSSDKTLVVRRDEEPQPSILLDLPAGRIVEITFGNHPAEMEMAEEAVNLVVSGGRRADSRISSGDRADRGAKKGQRERLVPKGRTKETKPAVTSREGGDDQPTIAPPGEDVSRKLPVGRFILTFGVVSIAVGLVLSFLWVQNRFSPGDSAPEIAKIVEELIPSAPTATGEVSAGEEAVEIPATVAGDPPGEVPVHEVNGGPGEGVASRVPVAPAATPASEGERLFGVHVESFPSGMEADQAARPYMDAGCPVTITVAEVPGKGTWHRIILGRFSSKTEAKIYSDEIKERFDKSYTLVVRIEK